MALSVKDGNGTLTSLRTTLSGSDHMPHHIIQEISGSNVTSIINKLTDISSSAAAVQTVTASLSNPVYITGSVSVIQPVIVDITASDFITASISNTFLTVTASSTNPIYVTGGVFLDNSSLTVTASSANPIYTTGTTFINNQSLIVTSSLEKPVFIANKVSVQQSSTRIAHNQYTVGNNYIDYTSSFSGTFEIANLDTNRSALIIFNSSNYNLYLNVGSSSDGPNGFYLQNTSSAPLKYSFVLFPSGTYFADQTTVSAFHAGFFISSSAGGFNPEALSTKVSF